VLEKYESPPSSPELELVTPPAPTTTVIVPETDILFL
jgi:hypothetical protein